MFNAMLPHGFNQEDILISTIISIPKDNRGSINSSDNYRGFSLSSSICKLYDYVFIYLNIDYLKTNDTHFGLKNNNSLFILRVLIIIGMWVMMFIAVLLTEARLLTGYTGGSTLIKRKCLLYVFA